MSEKKLKVLAMPGSLRTDSWNRKLLGAAVAVARDAGVDITLADLRDYPMPPYDGDVEASGGLPAGAAALKELMVAHHAFLIASPEYNASIGGMLKNALDWVSRTRPGEAPRAAYKGKVVGLFAASTGRYAGLRGLMTLRHVLGTLGAVVVPAQFGLSAAATAFDTENQLTSATDRAAVADVVAEVLRTAWALHFPQQ